MYPALSLSGLQYLCVPVFVSGGHTCMYTTATPNQDCQLDETTVAEHGTVSVWLGSASQVTVPELSTTINLYSTTASGARLTVTSHSGLLAV